MFMIIYESFLSLWRRKFDPRPNHVGYLVEKVALEQGFFEHSSFPVSFNRPVLCIHIFFYHQLFLITETKNFFK